MTQQSVVDLFQQLSRNEFGFFGRVSSVGEIMCRDFEKVNCSATLQKVLDTRNMWCKEPLAVIEPSANEVLGILESTTILRCCPRFYGTLGESKTGEAALNTSVSWLANRNAPQVTPDTSMLETLEQMIRGQHDCVLVRTEPYSLDGIVRPRDFVRLVNLYFEVCQPSTELQRLRLVDLDNELPLDEVFRRGAQTARDIMYRPWTIRPQDPVADAIRVMQQHKVRQVALVNDDGNVEGVITDRHILAAMDPPEKCTILDLPTTIPPLATLVSEIRDPVLTESASSLVNARPPVVNATCLLPEALQVLLATDQDAIIAEDPPRPFGMITMTTLMHVLRTLMRLELLKSG